MNAVRRLQVIAALAAALAVLAHRPALAQQQDDRFKAGLEAKNARKWQEMAAEMRRAIQIDSKEDKRKVGARLGIVGGTEYLPYYFLGEALFNMNDCAGAIDAWAESQKQGAVRARTESVTFMERGFTACESKGILLPARFDPQRARVAQQIADVRSLAESVSAAAKAHLEIWTGQASLREQYDRGTGELQQAQSRFTAAEGTRLERDFADASAAAERARGQFKTVESQLRAAIDATSNAQALAREVEQILRDAEASDRAIEAKRAKLSPSLTTMWQAARDTMAKARAQSTAAVGRSNVSQVIEARALAQDAAGKLRQVVDDVARLERAAVSQEVTAAAAITQQVFMSVEDRFNTAQQLFAQRAEAILPGDLQQRDALLKQVETVRPRFETAQRRQDLGVIQDIARQLHEVQLQLEAIIDRLKPTLEQSIRPELREGARLFFAGEYQKAIDWLDPAKLAGIRLELHVHLFRAAAAYALFVRSGSRDTAQRTLTIDAINRCKQIDPGFTPDPRAFGPRFVAFFQNVGPNGTQVQSGSTPVR